MGAGHATKTAALVAGRQRVWDSERKRGTDSGSGFSPNPATTAFDNFLTNGQTDSASAIVLLVKTFEWHEDLLGTSVIESDAIVADGKRPAGFFAMRADGYAGHFPSILQGIGDQVLHQLQKLHLFELDNRQFSTNNRCASIFDEQIEVITDQIQNAPRVYVRIRLFSGFFQAAESE